MLFKRITISLLLLAFISCGTEIYIPKQASNNASLAQLTEGRKLYVTRCSSCHQLYKPQQFTPVIWNKNLNDMQLRAKINDEQKQLILLYLTAL